MTFTLNRTVLMKELAVLLLAMERKQLIPVLATVMVGVVGNEVTLTATDLDLTITSTIAVEGDTWGGCLPCKQLYDLARLFEGDVITFTERANQRMEVRAGSAKHLLPITPISQFPEVERPTGNEVSLLLPQLTAAISAVSFAMLEPRDEIKPSDVVFTGLSLEAASNSLTVATSCKAVTAVAEMPCNASLSLLLPRGAVAALPRLEGDCVAIVADDNHAEFTAGSRVITARLLTGKFPNWRLFVPEYALQAEVKTAALSVALRRAQVTVEKSVGYESMKMTVSSDTLTIETRGGDRGQSLEVVEVSGNVVEPLSLGFFAHQMLGVLAVCGESITCHFADANKPIGVLSGDARYFVMPVRLKF